MSPSGLRVLSQSPLTRSPRPASTLAAELFIKGEESTGDPANFSMGLLAVLAAGGPMITVGAYQSEYLDPCVVAKPDVAVLSPNRRAERNAVHAS